MNVFDDVVYAIDWGRLGVDVHVIDNSKSRVKGVIDTTIKAHTNIVDQYRAKNEQDSLILHHPKRNLFKQILQRTNALSSFVTNGRADKAGLGWADGIMDQQTPC